MFNLLIHGTGSQGKLLYSEMRHNSEYSVVAFVCDDKYYSGQDFMGKPVYKLSVIEKYFSPDSINVISAGVYSSLRERYNSYLNIKSKGYKFINFISKNATVAENIEMGENNIIFGGVYLDYFGKMGNCNIIRPNTYIGYNFNIQNGVYIATGCNIAGYSTIEDLSFIGIGSTIIERKIIKKETMIGASSLITKDTEPYSLYIGSPAKKIRTHEETGIIL